MFNRKTTERVDKTKMQLEAKRAEKHLVPINIKDKVGAKLGINQAGRNISKILFEINRNRKNLKALGITDDDLKELGFE